MLKSAITVMYTRSVLQNPSRGQHDVVIAGHMAGGGISHLSPKEECFDWMNIHKQNFVCWPLVGPQDIKQTYIHTYSSSILGDLCKYKSGHGDSATRPYFCLHEEETRERNTLYCLIQRKTTAAPEFADHACHWFRACLQGA